MKTLLAASAAIALLAIAPIASAQPDHNGGGGPPGGGHPGGGAPGGGGAPHMEGGAGPHGPAGGGGEPHMGGGGGAPHGSPMGGGAPTIEHNATVSHGRSGHANHESVGSTHGPGTNGPVTNTTIGGHNEGGRNVGGRNGPSHGAGAHATGNFSNLRRNVQASHHFHAGGYSAPAGYTARRWRSGQRLPHSYFARNYWITDYALYALFAPPPGLTWVRVGDDALLIDEYSGEVIQVEYGVFY